MTLLEAAQALNLFLTSLLVGNEVGTWSVVHPALDTLPFEANVPAERAIVRRYGQLMPILMPLTIASGILVLALGRASGSFLLALAGVACLALMLAVTLAGNVPINKRLLAATMDTPPATWWALRRRWDRLHCLRVLLDAAALALLICGAIT